MNGGPAVWATALLRLKQTDVAISANGPRRTYTRPRELAGGPPLVVSLAVSRTGDVRDDAVDIIIFDHKYLAF